jgi:heme oxygenase
MNFSANDPDIMRQLVRRTDYYHDRFDAQYETVLFFDQTRENYHQFVRRLYGFYVSAEARLAKLQEGCIPALLSRLPALLKDLRAFGETDATIQQIPLCTDVRLETLDNLLGVMGYLYIIEGSLFGNDLVAQAVEQALHIDGETGTAFFHIIAFDEIIPRFNSIAAMLRGYISEHPDAKEGIIQGALDTILAYENWLFAGRIIRIKRIDSALHGHEHGNHEDDHDHATHEQHAH